MLWTRPCLLWTGVTPLFSTVSIPWKGGFLAKPISAARRLKTLLAPNKRKESRSGAFRLSARPVYRCENSVTDS